MRQPEWLNPTVYSQKAWWNSLVQSALTGPAMIFITRYRVPRMDRKISNPSIKFGRIE